MVQRHTLVLLLVAILLFGVGLTLFAYYGLYLQEYREVAVDFYVKEQRVGINTDTDALHMGGIPPEGFSSRRLKIDPANDGRLVVAFDGNISEYISVRPNNIPVREGELLRLNFTVSVPEDASLGNYSGVATFSFYRW